MNLAGRHRQILGVLGLALVADRVEEMPFAIER